MQYVIMRGVGLSLTLLAFVCLFVVPQAHAHEGAKGIVKERMDAMRSMGDAMKELAAMLRGKQSYDADRVRDLAARIAMHGGDTLIELFPEDSIEGPSEALPAIWEEGDAFAEQAEALTVAAEALAASATTKAEAMPGFRDLGRTCSSCHRDFRETDR